MLCALESRAPARGARTSDVYKCASLIQTYVSGFVPIFILFFFLGFGLQHWNALATLALNFAQFDPSSLVFSCTFGVPGVCNLKVYGCGFTDSPRGRHK